MIIDDPTGEALKVAAGIFAGAISLPMIIALLRAGALFGTMKKTIESIDKALTDYILASEKRFDEQDAVLTDHAGKLSVLWDGHDRRRA